jgi:hypothetical protein
VLPEVVGHVVLGEGGLGRERHVDLQRGGAVHEEVHNLRRARHHGEPAHHQVLASSWLQHGRRRRRPGSATQHKQDTHTQRKPEQNKYICKLDGTFGRRSAAAGTRIRRR